MQIRAYNRNDVFLQDKNGKEIHVHKVFSMTNVKTCAVLMAKLQKASLDPLHIRTYQECGGRIEKIVPRIAVWHHEACRVMTNGDPEGRIFLSYPHTNNGIFFLLITVFIIYFKISFQRYLNTLRCNFT